MNNGLVINAHGDKKYYVNGLLHREDGPAIEYVFGGKEYYKNDKLHRLDGPAIFYPAGKVCSSQETWWINGRHVNCSSQKEFKKSAEYRNYKKVH